MAKCTRMTVGLCIGLATAGCGAATTASDSTSSGSSGTNSSSCASGSNDFYVVENAACASGAGKLSRINPDATCKAEILTALNCPIDFVHSAVDKNIGYLSSKTDGILQVNLSAQTTTKISTTKRIIAPAGLALLENISSSEREGPCGGNTLVDSILLIADEGSELDGGMIWRWCLISTQPSILATGSNPSPVSEVPPSQVKHPHGVAVKNRTSVFITGQNPDISDTSLSAVLAFRELNKNEVGTVEFLTKSGDFSNTIKDLTIDSDGTLLIVDAGKSAILRYDNSAKTLTTLSTGFTGSPRDIVQSGTDSSGNATYLISQSDSGVISKTTFASGSSLSTVTTGLTLSGPEGIAK